MDVRREGEVQEVPTGKITEIIQGLTMKLEESVVGRVVLGIVKSVASVLR